MDKYYEICTHPLFKNFSERELKILVPLFKEYSCDEGAVIYYQKDGADFFSLFVEGEFCSSTADGGSKKFYFKGDFTNPDYLFAENNYSETLICRSSGKYLQICKRDFILFISNLKKNRTNTKVEYDESGLLISGLKYNIESFKKKKKVEGILEYQWRRSRYILFEKLIFPLFSLLLIILFSGSISFPHYGLLSNIIFSIISFYSLIRCVLWLSEKFTLTDENISAVKINFKPPGIKRNLLPLDQIRGIKIEKKKLKNRFFNVGSILIQTSSGTVLQLSDIDNPQKVQNTISDFILKIQKRSTNRERVEIRAKMESFFESREYLRPLEKEIETKIEEEDTVVFNKSIFFLVSLIWWQILAISVLLFLTYIFRESGGFLFILPVFPFLFVFLWRFQDWRNDLYKVEKGKIIDINKKPFGKSESNNLADIGFVTNIRSEKKGIFQYLFNYGDVLIETAGGSIKFETVSSPIYVQSKLLEMRENWKRKDEEKKRGQQFQDFLVYSEIYKQGEEQDRIVRLTPPTAKNLPYGVKK